MKLTIAKKKKQVFAAFAAEETFGLCKRLEVKNQRGYIGQTLREYTDHIKTLSSLEGKTHIALSVIAGNSKLSAAQLKKLLISELTDYLSRFFQLPVVLRKDQFSLKGYEGDRDEYEGSVQYNIGWLIIDFLVPALPGDAYVHAGITMQDLMTRQEGWITGVSGLADEELRCCLITTDGFNDTPSAAPSTSSSSSTTSSNHFLRRLISTFSHEILHALGFDHCEFFECLMNEGTESIEDNDKTPLYLCPLCSLKLEKLFEELRPFDPIKRTNDLLSFYERFHLAEEAAHLKKIIQWSHAAPSRGEKRKLDEEEDGDKVTKRSRTEVRRSGRGTKIVKKD